MAFLAGLGSIGSPCVLPLIPTYLTYLGGLSDGVDNHNRRSFSWRLMGHGALFILGFSLVFVLLGLSATGIGMLLLRHQVLMRHVSGLIIILFGANLMGLLRIRWLDRDWRWTRPMSARPAHRVSPKHSFALGIAFSAGWTACVGPVLASILTLAAQNPHWIAGATLLSWYSLGLGVPFLVMAAFVSRLQGWMTRIQPWLPWIQRVSGLLLIGLGLMIYAGIFARLSAAFSQY